MGTETKADELWRAYCSAGSGAGFYDADRRAAKALFDYAKKLEAEIAGGNPQIGFQPTMEDFKQGVDIFVSNVADILKEKNKTIERLKQQLQSFEATRNLDKR